VTNAERRERRRAAALKGAETRRARVARVAPHQVEAPEPPRATTAEETNRRAEDREAKRRANLRAVLAEAQAIRRESDLYYHAQLYRWPFSPARWTAEQIDSARQFLRTFYRKDGTPDPHPLRRKGRWRL
jgi:hypothetical protein